MIPAAAEQNRTLALGPGVQEQVLMDHFSMNAQDSGFNIHVFSYLCAGMCVDAWVHNGTHTCLCLWKPESNLGGHLSQAIHIVF